MAANPTAKPKVPKGTRLPQPHGGTLVVGAGGGPQPGSGRPPNWLKDWCDDLLAKKESKQQVEDILGDKDHAAYSQMWKAVAERAHGKPKEVVENTGTVTVNVVYSKE